MRAKVRAGSCVTLSRLLWTFSDADGSITTTAQIDGHVWSENYN
jgi:hypothetical protein